MQKEKSLTVKIDTETYKSLVAYCKSQGLLMKHVVGIILDKGIKQFNKEK